MGQAELQIMNAVHQKAKMLGIEDIIFAIVGYIIINIMKLCLEYTIFNPNMREQNMQNNRGNQESQEVSSLLAVRRHLGICTRTLMERHRGHGAFSVLGQAFRYLA